MTEAMIVQSAYEKLLLLPLGSKARARLNSTLANLRDELALMTGNDPEEIQNVCEALARH